MRRALKARFGDDPLFSDTLARLGVKKAPEREMGGISFDMYVTQADLDQYEAKKKKSNRVLDTRFDSRNGHDFFFKDTNKKAFKYDAMRGRVEFNSNSPTAIKAGLQKLMENTHKPDNFRLTGTEYAKREIWLQFHLMGLDKKGHTVSGYSPTQADKLKLEQEKNKFGNLSSKTTETATPNDPKEQQKSRSSAGVLGELVDAGKLDDEFKNGKVKGSGPVGGVLAGLVNAMTDLSNSFSANSIEDKFSEMRVLEKGIKDKNEEAESQRHEQKKQNRRNRNIPKPQ